MLAEKALLVEKIKLVHARSQVFWSQQDLADRAGVDRNTVKNCEGGGHIRLASAYRMLKALNSEREKVGIMPHLTLKDLDWKIYGFTDEDLPRGK